MQHRRLESGGVRRDRSARCVLSRRWRGQAAATYCSSGSRQAVLFCSPLLVACACLLVSYCASSTEPVHVPYPGNGDQLDPARRFERDAVGRELVSRASRAVPAAPDGLGRPGKRMPWTSTLGSVGGGWSRVRRSLFISLTTFAEAQPLLPFACRAR